MLVQLGEATVYYYSWLGPQNHRDLKWSHLKILCVPIIMILRRMRSITGSSSPTSIAGVLKISHRRRFLPAITLSPPNQYIHRISWISAIILSKFGLFGFFLFEKDGGHVGLKQKFCLCSMEFQGLVVVKWNFVFMKSVSLFRCSFSLKTHTIIFSFKQHTPYMWCFKTPQFNFLFG